MITGVLLLVVAAAAVVVAARQGPRWWIFVLAGAAGWFVAQEVKGAVSLPLLVGPHARSVASLTTALWYPFFGAALPAVFEALGKYLPLRWLRVADRRQALALGLGAGALEAAVLAIPTFPAGGAAFSPLGALVAVWERAFAVTLHGGLATMIAVAALAPGRRRPIWLLAAMGLHFLSDLPAGAYQHAQAVSSGAAPVFLVVTEVLVAVFALVSLYLGRRAWSQTAP